MRRGPYRLHFYSHEPDEPPHIHVSRDDNLAKFWLAPVRLASAVGFRPVELRLILGVVRRHEAGLLEAWYDHFG